MWWKILTTILVVYAIIAGLVAPLKPGVAYVSPLSAKAGQPIALQVHGYNSFYSRSSPESIRVWLQYDSAQAILGANIKVLSDTTLEASFLLPPTLPKASPSVMVNVIVDHPTDGVSLLPFAVEILADSAATGNQISWNQQPVQDLHIIKDFSYPYRNVIYESIRNTYFHVPMWFALMFMFIASVYYSVMYLRNPDPELDRRAVAFTETGLLFGILGLTTGMLWAHYAWGAAWSNDIKQLMTAVALLIYLAYFILRASFDEPEKGARLAAVYNIFAFSSLVPLLYIVPRMFASLHPGATGNPAFGSEDLDNTMRLVFYPAIIGFTLLGVWMAQVRYRSLRVQDQLADLD
jgi:heme exporter protein C